MMWILCGFPVRHRPVAVGQAAQATHTVDSAGSPAGGIGLQAAADQLLAGTFDLAAADACVTPPTAQWLHRSTCCPAAPQAELVRRPVWRRSSIVRLHKTEQERLLMDNLR